ncbi:MAG: hypothetical protein QOI61_1690, partial [Actinomycetota bacterium]
MARSAQRTFWSLQSRTWDQPLATESARRSVDEVVAILAAHVTGGVIVDVG